MRNIGFEKSLLLGTARVIQRRNTTTASSAKSPMILKNIKKVPIGARGRKRNALVAYIGLQSNPDGRKHGQQIVPGTSANSVPIRSTPGRRTYAKAISTPLHLPSVDSYALLYPNLSHV